MADYKQVEDALAAGTDPALLCATCPWDRYCVMPPTMTRGEYDAQIAESQRKDDAQRAEAAARGEKTPLPIGSLLTALTFSGKTNSGPQCPVFALRLRTSAGRTLADGIKTQMQAWGED